MALVLADRVQETSTTSGTGTLTLIGAVSGFTTFSSAIGNSNTTYYTIYDPVAYSWEVGIGTVGSGTLSRDTVLSNSLGTTAKINLAGNTASVFCTYPSEKSVNLDSSGNVSPLGTIASGTWQGSTIAVAYGGTGVTASSGANSVVLRDSNQNIVANKISQSVNNITASGGTTSLTASSAFWQTLQGTGAHTIKLPDATTLPIGFWYVFDNDSTGNLTIQDFASSTLDVVPPGGYSLFYLDDIASVAGSWNRAGLIPSEVNWGTNSLDLGGSTVITNGTWQGTAVAPAYGGTGLTTFSAANNALYSTGATTLTAGTLPVAAGGTGQTTYTDGELLIGNSTGNTLTKATLTAGSGISITNSTGSITIAATGGGDVVGPASATDNAIARFDSTTGKLIQNSVVTIDDTTGTMTFTATGARIIGDFSNNTQTSRLLFQTSTSNGNTIVGAIPNGTSTSSSFGVFNSSDPTNAARLRVAISNTSANIISEITGTGTYLPITFQTNNAERMRLDTSGNLGIGASATAGYRLDVAGNFKVSGSIDENVYAVVDAAGVALSPQNGTIQTWTLGASRTPTLGTWAEGESMTLMINDGTAFTVTWTTMGIVWVGGSAPTLATSGFTVVELWRVGSTYYGALVGNVA